MRKILCHGATGTLALLTFLMLFCGAYLASGKAKNGTLPLQVRVSASDSTRPLARFVVYGDTRTNHAVHQEIVNRVVEVKPDFILQTGDLVQYADQELEWQRFDKITQPIRDAKIPYYPARGNHDSGGASHYLAEVREKFESGNKLYYRFDVKNLRFISLDTESPLGVESDQYKWLEGELQQAIKDGKNVIPFFHEAIFSVGRHGSNERLQSLLHPLFKKYGVKLVFQGHDHLYYRTSRDDITYIVTGGGGAPLYEIHPELMIKGDVAKELHHFCIAEVFPDRIDVKVLTPDMKKIDEFSVALSTVKQAEKGYEHPIIACHAVEAQRVLSQLRQHPSGTQQDLAWPVHGRG